MSTPIARTYLPPGEYINWERKAVTKHEYLDGEIVAMSGASNVHNIIWQATEFQKLDDVAPVLSIECELLLRHIYRRVTFSE